MRTPILLPINPIIFPSGTAAADADSLINAPSLNESPLVTDPQPVVHYSYETAQIHSDGSISRAMPRPLFFASSHDGDDGSRPSSRPTMPYLPSTHAAPPDNGVIRQDVEAWRAAHQRSRIDATFVKILMDQIRVNLWRALAEEESTALTEAVIKGHKVTVRIAQTGDGLRNFDVALFSGKAAYTNSRQVMWELDTTRGLMELVGHVDHMASEFGRFYSSIRFQSLGLAAGTLIQAMSTEQRERLHQSSSSSAVVLYYNHVHFALMRQMTSFCEAWRLPQMSRIYLLHLADAILRGLYRKEVADPEFGRLPMVQIWIRNAWQQPSESSVEVDQGHAFIGKEFGPQDINLSLIRHDPKPEVYTYIEHQDIHYDSDIDAQFLRNLGIPHPRRLHIRLDALHPDFRSAG